jgi:uncharacterized protein YjiS (DUF1127 family)
MTSRYQTAIPDGRQGKVVQLPPAIASRWREVRSALTHWLARRRLGRSIAHLDDRMLADIGLGPEDLGFSERSIRRRAAEGRPGLSRAEGA